ncbi:lysine-specific demethylase JMJ28-like [Bidens hawaiensis]|uniref:lysine-specific demethylase JMJ28-like n=1 Tax=Bidens hawaiensis TaxID=980011 RepID=UPI00404B6841
MAQNGADLPDDLRCKRHDGRQWRCRRPAAAGRTLCEAHCLQGRLRQTNQPVPESLKLDRRNNNNRVNHKRGKTKIQTEIHSIGSTPSRKRRKRGVTEGNSKSSVDISEDLDDALKKMNLKKGDLQLDLIRGYLNRQIEKKKGKESPKEDIVKELKYGRLEISQGSTSSPPVTVSNVKVGASSSGSVRTRLFRSKNIDRVPIATMQILPDIKAAVKAATKKCHWCRMCSYRVLVKCLNCKKHFFCEDCIRARSHDKAEVKKQCPVCSGTCSCSVCEHGKSKEVKTKDLVVYSDEEKFDKNQQLLYMIHLLLPLIEQINQEKYIEMDIEAKIKGKDHTELQIHEAIGSPEQQCCGFCKASTVDVYRSCENCSYILCLSCCREFREGHLHGGFKDFKNTSTNKGNSLWNWKTSVDGSIGCPPKNLGGCGDGSHGLVCHPPFDSTKDLEKLAKETVCDRKFTTIFDLDFLYCTLCDENDKIDGESEILINKILRFSTKEDLGDKNVEHFTKHWVKGQPLIIQDVIKSNVELSWDPIFMFFMYLDRSVKSRNDKETKSKNISDWFEVKTGRQQIFMGGKTHANVWNEKLKFKVCLSSRIFQEHFPSHYDAVMHALPLQEYTNPLTGVLNLAANVPPESQNVDLGPFVYLSYGKPEDLIEGDFLSKLCYHAYDMVNILVHATELLIPEKKLNKVKILLKKYSSKDHNESSRKNQNKNILDETCGKSSFSSEVTQQSELEDNTNEELTQTPNDDDLCVFSDDDSSNCDSDDEDLCDDESESCSSGNEGKVVDTCGAQWDVFRREDVDKLVEFLTKYSDKLNSSCCSPQKVVHPIHDESFYLNAFHKRCLKEEFDVEPWTFDQHIGEAVIVPAGCPYQVKKSKSCVNVVFESISPESASVCLKLSDEIRQLPVTHKAKGKMIDVKKMTIHSVNAAVEEIHKVSQVKISDKVE